MAFKRSAVRSRLTPPLGCLLNFLFPFTHAKSHFYRFIEICFVNEFFLNYVVFTKKQTL